MIKTFSLSGHSEQNKSSFLSVTISYHLYRFLNGKFSVAEIRYLSWKKENENEKNTFLMKNNNKNTKKVYVNTK